MAAPPEQEDISLISKGLYRVVRDVIGPECIVKLRRKRYNITDRLINCDSYIDTTSVPSGSRAEGYDFKSSDFDIMFVDRKISVLIDPVFSLSQNFPSLLLMESKQCSPGFTLLRCLKCDISNELLYNSLILKANDLYVSSKVKRETFVAHSFNQEHGPCNSIQYYGTESDFVYTLSCPVWPTQAMSFITRSIERGWPSYELVKDICNEGCLFVPISSKHQACKDVTDLEWRISFSQAEQKLISSMNHCQFLCYGLSKIFLNEVLKEIPAIDGLLCSYFMKTAVFWGISDNPQGWSAKTLLNQFWNAFRRLLKWVSIGYCPNFFIPENNMFHGKICRENQQTLLTVLCELYSEGFRCLLRCPSLNKKLSLIIRQPFIALALSCNEAECVPESEIEKGKLQVILVSLHIGIRIDDLNTIRKMLTNTIKLHINSEEMMYAVRLRINYILHRYAESLLASAKISNAIPINNQTVYQSRKQPHAILYRTKTHFCMNYLIYATSIYTSGNYHKAIEVLHYIKHRLHSKPYMYTWSLDDDIIMALRQQGMPYDTLIKSFIVTYVEMDDLTTLEELQLECRATGQLTGLFKLVIPPLLLINFLLILSYYRLEESTSQYDILEELHDLVYHGDGYHFPFISRAISWEVLGICQDICGHYQAAFQSYINALNDKYNYFKEATITRIQRLFIQ